MRRLVAILVLAGIGAAVWFTRPRREEEPPPRPERTEDTEPAGADGPGEPDFLEMRINEYDRQRYVRVQRDGYVEFATYNFYGIKHFRAGTAPGEAERVFGEFYARHVDEFAGSPGGQFGGPQTIDPAETRLEVRDGKLARTIIYRVRELPPEVHEFHRGVLTWVFEWPLNERAGDYLRQYVVHDTSVVPERYARRRPSAEELAADPALVLALRCPGRLIWAAEPGQAAQREYADVDPLGFFLEHEGALHRFSILEYAPGK